MAARGCSMRDLLGFFVGAAVAAACIVLLQPSAPCPPCDLSTFSNVTTHAPPCPCGLVVPADHQEHATTLGNGTTHAAPGPCRLVALVDHRQELATSGNGTTHADPCSTKPADTAATSPGDDKLPELLRRAVMDDDKTVIMTFTNEAFAAPNSLLDLFLHSFRVGVRTEPLLKHLVIVAVDAKAYDRCNQVHPICYHLPVQQGTDYSAELPFMKDNYLDMMWRRNRFQARVLSLGYSFVFTDVDIVWFRNPLLRIPVAVDLAMTCDRFYGNNPYDLNKRANGGFVYARASARTVAFYEDWYAARAAYPGKNEQDLFDKLKLELSARHGVTVQFVDTAYLGGFCDRRKGRDFNKLCTYHGNCLYGLKMKLKRLNEVFADWNKFRANNALTD
nr:unnamed protein product [Digitaria exilis]